MYTVALRPWIMFFWSEDGMLFLISWITFFPLVAWNVGCCEYFGITLPSVKTHFIWGQLRLVPAFCQCKGYKILLNVASALPAVLPFSGGVCEFSLQQLMLRAWPSWQCGRADVSPEEEGVELAPECPPRSCAGTSSSCAVRMQPSGGDTALALGLALGPALGPCGAPGHESHGALIRTDITHHDTTDPMRQKCHGLFWKCYLMLISLCIRH